jgi:hypothetical protein
MVSWHRYRGRQSANDREPTVEEIQKPVEYPDRQMETCCSTQKRRVEKVRRGAKFKIISSMYIL